MLYIEAVNPDCKLRVLFDGVLIIILFLRDRYHFRRGFILTNSLGIVEGKKPNLVIIFKRQRPKAVSFLYLQTWFPQS